MGRPPLNEATTKEITIRLIRTAQELILKEGLETVTIRKIANQAGVNSAVLYKHFQDLDELLLFASVDLFKSYASDIVYYQSHAEFTDPETTYIINWELFCRYAFKFPECVSHLFFSKHSDQLKQVIQVYYDLFPEQLEGMSKSLKVMLRTANLYQRNLELLRPLLKDHVDQERLQLINDLTVLYFRKLLLEKINDRERFDDRAQTEHMLCACKLLATLTGPCELPQAMLPWDEITGEKPT